MDGQGGYFGDFCRQTSDERSIMDGHAYSLLISVKSMDKRRLFQNEHEQYRTFQGVCLPTLFHLI
jgi:hypothetical protein